MTIYDARKILGIQGDFTVVDLNECYRVALLSGKELIWMAYDVLVPLAINYWLKTESNQKEKKFNSYGGGVGLDFAAIRCNGCDGEGFTVTEIEAHPKTADLNCDKCKGRGYHSYACKRCNGKGQGSNGKRCFSCGGSGRFVPAVKNNWSNGKVRHFNSIKGEAYCCSKCGGSGDSEFNKTLRRFDPADFVKLNLQAAFKKDDKIQYKKVRCKGCNGKGEIVQFNPIFAELKCVLQE